MGEVKRPCIEASYSLDPSHEKLLMHTVFLCFGHDPRLRIMGSLWIIREALYLKYLGLYPPIRI
mgnify:CR=1 FL=1